MSLFRRIVKVPPGVKVIVGGRVVTERPLRLGAYELAHFLSTEPVSLEVAGKTTCKEGVVFSVKIFVALNLQESDLGSLLADAGDSYRWKMSTISAADFVKRKNIESSIKGAINSYIQSRSFFSIQDANSVKQDLNLLIHDACSLSRLVGSVESCQEITYDPPSPNLLAIFSQSNEAELKRIAEYFDKVQLEKEIRAMKSGQSELTTQFIAKLSALAGRSVIDGKTVYEDSALGNEVKFFEKAHQERQERDLEAQRQAKLQEIEVDKIRAEKDLEIERIKSTAGPELERLRRETLKAQTDSKNFARDQENRIREHDAQLKEQEQQWEKGSIIRNGAIMEMRAHYEAEHKKKRHEEEVALEKARLEEEKNLAAMRTEVILAKEMELSALREEKRLDMQLALEQDQAAADLRIKEATEKFTHLTALIEKIKIPVSDYSHVKTLFLNSGENKPGDMIAGLLVELMQKMINGAEIPIRPSIKKRAE